MVGPEASLAEVGHLALARPWAVLAAIQQASTHVDFHDSQH